MSRRHSGPNDEYLERLDTPHLVGKATTYYQDEERSMANSGL